MRANTLSICMPYYGCNKNCPYCISKMTGYTDKDLKLFYRNIKKAAEIAKRCNVLHVSLTSKGEPFFNEKSKATITKLLDRLSGYFSCEVQTNFKNVNSLDIDLMSKYGLDTFAISIDDINTIILLAEAFSDHNQVKSLHKNIAKQYENIVLLKNRGITIRAVVNLVPGTYEFMLEKYIDLCKAIGIEQLSFREITIPNMGIAETKEAKDTAAWINNSIDKSKLESFYSRYNHVIKNNGKLERELPFGAKLYNLNGISVTHFDYCIQDNSKNDDVRSLILHEDGHMSTSWYGSNYGRIF